MQKKKKSYPFPLIIDTNKKNDCTNLLTRGNCYGSKLDFEKNNGKFSLSRTEGLKSGDKTSGVFP